SLRGGFDMSGAPGRARARGGPMADEALHQLSAAEMAAGFAERTFSPVDVTEAVLARVAAWEPKLNAMYLVFADQARTAAAQSEARWRAREMLSPLDGVP